MTIEWHSDALTISDTIDFPIPEAYSYRASLYDVGGIPHNQFNGLYEFVGGASNCAWQTFYQNRLETYELLVQQQSPYQIDLEGELIDSTFNYSVVVSLVDDIDEDNMMLELFVAEDSILALWSACDSWHNTRNVARAYLTMGEEKNRDQKDKNFLGFTINKNLLNNALDNAIVPHCLPAYRDKEITDEVINCQKSRIFDQAENRLHVQQALLSCLIN